MPGTQIDAIAECTHCKATKKVKVSAGSGLKPGDALYEDPTNHNFARCVRCKRTKLIIKQVETSTSTNKPRGFWKIPQGQGSGSSE